MFIILSPAKKQQTTQALYSELATERVFVKESDRLVERLRTLSVEALSKLMSISSALAKLNHERFQAYQLGDTGSGVSALFAFKGDVYRALSAETWCKEDCLYAQRVLGIVSGLYGVLRPLDRIQPYRLEMKTKLSLGKDPDLYAYWGEKLSDYVAQCVGQGVCINLASNEYAKAILNQGFSVPVITPVFKEQKGEAIKVVGLFSKRARGLMARYAVLNRLSDPQALKNFNEEGYCFMPEYSTDVEWVFVRK